MAVWVCCGCGFAGSGNSAMGEIVLRGWMLIEIYLEQFYYYICLKLIEKLSKPTSSNKQLTLKRGIVKNMSNL